VVRKFTFLLTVALVITACGPSLPTVWVNLFVDCPDSPRYGDVLVPDTSLFLEPGNVRALTRVPHGTAVELLSRDEEWAHVRYSGLPGYVSANLISDYDPAEGVQPEPASCAA
jgi:hypothetical protein